MKKTVLTCHVNKVGSLLYPVTHTHTHTIYALGRIYTHLTGLRSCECQVCAAIAVSFAVCLLLKFEVYTKEMLEPLD